MEDVSKGVCMCVFSCKPDRNKLKKMCKRRPSILAAVVVVYVVVVCILVPRLTALVLGDHQESVAKAAADPTIIPVTAVKEEAVTRRKRVYSSILLRSPPLPLPFYYSLFLLFLQRPLSAALLTLLPSRSRLI